MPAARCWPWCLWGEDAMRVAKCGNSLAVRLPKKLVEALGLKIGDEIKLSGLADGAVGVEKVDPGAEFLKAMQQFIWPIRRVTSSIVTKRTSGEPTEAGCETLFSEDFAHGRRFGDLTIINPFL
jgi:antitoxin MazE